MNTLSFSKYQGTGNDFILIDNRDKSFPKDVRIISELCNRKFGIGSDGLILIENHDDSDFEMVFYNPDGSQSFCGNGSRCAVAFAHELGIVQKESVFLAIDGEHKAVIIDQNVRVKMADTVIPEKMLDGYFLNTGSPHFVKYVPQLENYDVFENGKEIRSKSNIFGLAGTNVNFVKEISKGSVFVRTFERGVENETLSCGTGVTATAITYGIEKGMHNINVKTPGGTLEVDFNYDGGNTIQDIFLTGPAEKVFEGKISLS